MLNFNETPSELFRARVLRDATRLWNPQQHLFQIDPLPWTLNFLSVLASRVEPGCGLAVAPGLAGEALRALFRLARQREDASVKFRSTVNPQTKVPQTENRRLRISGKSPHGPGNSPPLLESNPPKPRFLVCGLTYARFQSRHCHRSSKATEYRIATHMKSKKCAKRWRTNATNK